MMWCSWHRWKINQAMDTPGSVGGRPVISVSTARHLQRCPSCRGYLARMTAVGARLADDASEWRAAPAGDMRGFAAPVAERGPVLFRINWSLAAAAMVVMGMMVGVYFVSNSSTTESPQIAVEPGAPEAPRTTVALQTPDVPRLVSTSATMVSGLLNNQTELLAMDTRRAAEFLLDQIPMSDRWLAEAGSATP